MKLNDTVVRRPITFGDGGIDDFVSGKKKLFFGNVVYIHPKGRFHVVEFSLWGRKIRETFFGA